MNEKEKESLIKRIQTDASFRIKMISETASLLEEKGIEKKDIDITIPVKHDVTAAGCFVVWDSEKKWGVVC